MYQRRVSDWQAGDDRVNSLNPRPTAHANQRRSQRILLSVPIIVAGFRANKAPFVEHTSTMIVNAHGALIQLRERVLVGQTLRIKNTATNEEMNCTVMDINPGNASVPEVGVEFVEPSPRFWRVSFPPADWSSRSPEAKRAEKGMEIPASPKNKTVTPPGPK